MSADGIRRLAGEQPGDMTATDVNCIDISDEIRDAILAYAAMVERCEEKIAEYKSFVDVGIVAENINDLNYILRGDAGKEEK